MTDIDLLKDTKSAKDTKEDGKESSDLEYSDPEKYSFEEKEGKPSSGFSMWLKKLFGRKETKKEPGIITMEKGSKPKGTDESLSTELGMADERFSDMKKTGDQVAQSSAPPPLSPNIGTPTDQSQMKTKPTPLAPLPAQLDPIREEIKKEETPGSGSEKEGKKGLKLQPPKKPEPPTEEPPPSSFDVNLLPEDLAGQYAPKKKLINLAIASGLTIVALVLIYVGMSIYQSSIVSRTEEIRNEAAQVGLEMKKFQEERNEALAFMETIELIEERLNQHIYWTKFFELLEKYTVSDVFFSSSFAGDITGQLNLNATGKDYSSVARQLLAFEAADDFIESVEINSAARTKATENEVSAVLFSINLTLVSDVFVKDFDLTEEENQ